MKQEIGEIMEVKGLMVCVSSRVAFYFDIAVEGGSNITGTVICRSLSQVIVFCIPQPPLHQNMQFCLEILCISLDKLSK